MTETYKSDDVEATLTSVRRLLAMEPRPKPGTDLLVLTPALRVDEPSEATLVLTRYLAEVVSASSADEAVPASADETPPWAQMEPVARKAKASKRGKSKVNAPDAAPLSQDAEIAPAPEKAADTAGVTAAPPDVLILSTAVAEAAEPQPAGETAVDAVEPVSAGTEADPEVNITMASVPQEESPPFTDLSEEAKPFGAPASAADVSSPDLADATGVLDGGDKPADSATKIEAEVVESAADLAIPDPLAPLAVDQMTDTLVTDVSENSLAAEAEVPGLAQPEDAADLEPADPPSGVDSSGQVEGRVLTDPDGNPVTILDEDALNDIVRQLIHEELQGALGERITSAVRKLVRAEVRRLLEAQKLE